MLLVNRDILYLERDTRVELVFSAWKADVEPLN